MTSGQFPIRSLWRFTVTATVLAVSFLGSPALIRSADAADATVITTVTETDRSVISKTAGDITFGFETFARDTWYIYAAPLRLNRASALWLGGFALAGGLIYNWDQDIYDAINRNRNESAYKPMRRLGEAFEPVGHMGNTNPYYFGLLGGSYLLGIDKLTLMSAQILEAHFVTGLGKNLSRELVGRRRPHEGKGPRAFDRGEGTSFPSGHTINIFELATVISHHFNYRAVQISAYTVATAVGFQRITDHQHWPSDVFAAALFGTITTRALLARHAKTQSACSQQPDRVGRADNTAPELETGTVSSWLIAPVFSARQAYFGLAFSYRY